MSDISSAGLPPLAMELKAEAGEFLRKMSEAGEHFKKVIGGMEQDAGARSKAIGAGLMGIGAAATIAGTVITKIGDADKQAMNQLKQAVENTGGSFDKYKEDIEKVEAAGRKKAFGDKEQSNALATLTTSYGETDKALGSMGLAEDIARSRHMSLTAAADLLSKVHAGKAGKALSAFGISADDLAKRMGGSTQAIDDQIRKLKEQEAGLGKTETATKGAAKGVKDHNAALKSSKAAIADQIKALELKKGALKGSSAEEKETATLSLLTEKTHGQASAAVNTFSGHLKVMAVEAEHMIAKLGPVGHALTLIGPASMLAGTAAQFMAARQAAAGVAAGVATAPTMGFVGSLWATATAAVAAAAPFLAIIAVVALVGIAIYELYKHWDTVWSKIKSVARAAWHFLSNTVFLPIKLEAKGMQIAFEFLRDAWDTVWGGIKKAAKAAWDFLSKIVFAPIKLEAKGMLIAYEFLGKAWGAVWGGITDAVSSAWDTISGIFGSIQDAVSSVIGAISSVGNAISSIPGAGAIGSLLGFAEGGTVPGPTGAPRLAVVHGGEQVIPVGGGGSSDGGGGSVVVHVYGTVTSERDLVSTVRDALLRTDVRNSYATAG